MSVELNIPFFDISELTTLLTDKFIPEVLIRNTRLLELRAMEIFLNASVSETRQVWCDWLCDLYHNGIEVYEGKFERIDVEVEKTFLEYVLTNFGLITKEELAFIRENVIDGVLPFTVSPVNAYFDKVRPFEYVCALGKGLSEMGYTVGCIHGCFDPLHLRHSRLGYLTSLECELMLWGIEGANKIEQMKSTNDDIRPRFPQIEWRMAEIATLPALRNGYVFEIPEVVVTEHDYTDMFRELGVTLMGTFSDHRYAKQSEERMQKFDGGLIVDAFKVGLSSTMQMNIVRAGRSKQLGCVFHEEKEFIRRSKTIVDTIKMLERRILHMPIDIRADTVNNIRFAIPAPELL